MQEVLKYQVKISFKVDGVVEKPDIVGAIFGQTEGLFGPELNLNELQKTFKIGSQTFTLTENGRWFDNSGMPCQCPDGPELAYVQGPPVGSSERYLLLRPGAHPGAFRERRARGIPTVGW